MSGGATDDDITVVDDADGNRFEILDAGTVAGFSLYRVRGEALYSFVHTEIEGVYGGRGLGSRLIHDTLEVLRARGVSVLPYCQFVRGYIAGHAEYLELVPADRRAEFGLPSPG